MAARWCLVPTAPVTLQRAFRRSTSFTTPSLPPPALHGSAATNPRSVYNPLVLAYLGDAVWEAHTRRFEVEAEAEAQARRNGRQPQSRWPQSEELRAPGCDEQRLLDPTGGPGGSWGGEGFGSGRPGGRGGGGHWKGAGGRGREGAAGSRREAGRAGAGGRQQGGGGGEVDQAASSRDERKRWPTATFQALVFDALMAGGLPPPPPPPPPAPPSEGRTSSASCESPAAAAAAPSPPTSTSQSTSPCPYPSPAPAPEPFVLTTEELDVLRWGRNASVSSVPRSVPVLVYKKATALEVLVAHMYLTTPDRCTQLIQAAVAAPLFRPGAAPTGPSAAGPGAGG